MRMLIRYFGRPVQPAMLLAAIGNNLRAAVPGADDAVDFQFVNGQWVTAKGEPVEIEFEPAAGAFYRAVPHKEAEGAWIGTEFTLSSFSLPSRATGLGRQAN